MEKETCRNCDSTVFYVGEDFVDDWLAFVVRCGSCNRIHVFASRHDISDGRVEEKND